MSVSGHYTFTYTCNSCGRKAQKHRVCDENAAVDSLRDPFSYPKGWQYRGGDGPLRHFCPECLALDEQNARVPLTIRYAVMRWHKAFVAGNEDESVARCDDVFSAATTLVLGEEGLKEAGKLHDAAIDERERQLYGRNSRRWDPDCPKMSEQFPSAEDE